MPDIGKLGARILIALTVFLALATTSVVDVTPAHAQTDEAAALNQQVIKLYNEGRYSEAIQLAQRLLTIQEKALGPEHPDVATSLNNLASLYQALGRYA